GRSAHDERKEAETPATEQTDTTEPSEGAPVATDEPQSEVAEANVAEANVAEAATAEATPTNEQKAE
ncbi:MAG: hypothetical protein IKB14_00535, partial [Rikenellaceae bacterium]|nr:hypothetical protein [Rikenellaceae bacterium]